MAPSQSEFDRLIAQGREFARQQAEDARRREGPDDAQIEALALRSEQEELAIEAFEQRREEFLDPEVAEAIQADELEALAEEDPLLAAEIAADDLERLTGEETLSVFDQVMANRPEGLPNPDDPDDVADFFLQMEEAAREQERQGLIGCEDLQDDAQTLANDIAALADESDPDAFASKLSDLEGRVDAFQSVEQQCSTAEPAALPEGRNEFIRGRSAEERALFESLDPSEQEFFRQSAENMSPEAIDDLYKQLREQRRLELAEAAGDPIIGDIETLLLEEAGIGENRIEEFEALVQQNIGNAARQALRRAGIEAVSLADDQLIALERDRLKGGVRRNVIRAAREEIRVKDIFSPEAEDIVRLITKEIDTLENIPVGDDDGFQIQQQIVERLLDNL